ncbi:hypothetical protein ACFUKV_36705 [Streptomyces paradoxus]
MSQRLTVRTLTGRPSPSEAPQTYTFTSVTGHSLRLEATGPGAPAADETV